MAGHPNRGTGSIMEPFYSTASRHRAIAVDSPKLCRVSLPPASGTKAEKSNHFNGATGMI